MNKAGTMALNNAFQNGNVVHTVDGVAKANRLRTERPEPRIVFGRVNFHSVWKILVLP